MYVAVGVARASATPPLPLFYLTTLSSSALSLPNGTRKCTLVERSDSIRSMGFEKDLERNGWRIQVSRSTLHISIDPTHEKALPCPAKPEGL